MKRYINKFTFFTLLKFGVKDSKFTNFWENAGIFRSFFRMSVASFDAKIIRAEVATSHKTK